MVCVTAVELLALLVLVEQELGLLVEAGAGVALMQVGMVDQLVAQLGFSVPMIGPVQCKAITNCSIFFLFSEALFFANNKEFSRCYGREVEITIL